MNKEQIIASLNKVANELDNNGLFNEANLITNIMKRLSQYTQETQPPAANALNERAQAGQMSNEQIAQNFIEKNRLNPNLKTAQDFYYEAQRQGLPQSILNSIAALIKAESYKDQTANVLNETTQAGQMNNTQIAQNFIEKNRSNPNLKTAQDFYYEAQRQGLPQPILNSIATLTKAESYKDQTANVLNETTQAGQMSNAQIAQNFIEKNRSNPNLKTAQDFYYEAQRQGLPQPILNSIAALTKAEGYKDQTKK